MSLHLPLERVSPLTGLSAVLLMSALGLYAWAMIPHLLAEATYGPICSGHPAWTLHCPACYAAAAVALAALAGAIAAISPTASPSPTGR
jgi:hypothetical protein